MQTIFQRWGSGIVSFLIAIATGVSALSLTPFSWIVLWQLIPIVVTGSLTWLIPLASGKWKGAFKTGLDILSLIAVIILPFAISGTWTRANIILIAIALLKGVATEIGVQIRLDPVVAPSAGIVVTADGHTYSGVLPVAGVGSDPTPVGSIAPTPTTT